MGQRVLSRRESPDWLEDGDLMRSRSIEKPLKWREAVWDKTSPDGYTPTADLQLERDTSSNRDGLTILILARNEAGVLHNTLPALLAMTGTEDHIHIVADQCTDETATVAQQAGVIVHVRSVGPPGKGPALVWWLERTRGNTGMEAIVILDADSRIPSDFLRSMRRRLASGEVALQARIMPVVSTESPLARLAAFSEIVEQQVNDALRARLGWPVRLRGTGMAFRRSALELVCQDLRTQVEDIELTLLLASRGIPIAYAAETHVEDPKPYDEAGAVRQRTRWLRGQVQILRSYPGPIFRLLLRGLPGWSLLCSVLLKPRTLMVPLKAALIIGAALTPGWIWEVSRPLVWVMVFSLIWDLAVTLFGLRHVPDPRATLSDLFLTPLYLAMWLKSAALSLVSDGTWLRVRPNIPDMLFDARDGD